MAQFTYLQKIAMLRIMQEFLRADRGASSKAKMFYLQTAERLHMGEQALREVNRASALIALSRVKGMEAEQKRYLGELLGQLLECCGVGEEREYLKNILKAYADVEAKRTEAYRIRAEFLKKDFVYEPFRMVGTQHYCWSSPLKGTQYIGNIPDDHFYTFGSAKEDGERMHRGPFTARTIAEVFVPTLLDSIYAQEPHLYHRIKDAYRRASEDGLHEAANNLGIMANAIEHNQEEGLRYLTMAAEHGSEYAAQNIFNILWYHNQKEEAVNVLQRFADKGMLLCKWNLMVLWHEGDKMPGNPLQKNEKEERRLYHELMCCDNDDIMAATFRYDEGVAYERGCAERCGDVLPMGKLFLHYLHCSHGTPTPEMVLRLLSLLKVETGWNLKYRRAEEVNDNSRFYVENEAGMVEWDMTKHLWVSDTEMGAWELYLLRTAYTLLPCHWHGAYYSRMFVFDPADLTDIETTINSKPLMRHVDLSQVPCDERLCPSVRKEGNMAHVYCCYWNDWEGLIREHTTLVFEDGRVRIQSDEHEALYPYHCGTIL